jgi:hypothetical protein
VISAPITRRSLADSPGPDQVRPAFNEACSADGTLTRHFRRALELSSMIPRFWPPIASVTGSVIVRLIHNREALPSA